METQKVDSRVAVVPVRVSLSCGWCAHQVPDVDARMETAAGRIHLMGSQKPLPASGRRPVCPRCGGPMFVDDWKVIRRGLPILTDESDEDADSREALPAA